MHRNEASVSFPRNRTLINRAIYMEKKKKGLSRAFFRSLRQNWEKHGRTAFSGKRGKSKKREKRREKGAARSDLSRGNQIFEEQKRENGESASSSLLLGWKIVIVHGESVRFSGQSGG